MNNMSLPGDLINFLKSGRSLQFDQSKLGMKSVVLKTLEELVLEEADVYPDHYDENSEDPHLHDSGRYAVPVVSLIKECGDEYTNPFGLLLWVPQENCFATYDEEHDALFLLDDKIWTDIENDPLPILNIQWSAEEELDISPLTNPWEKYRWYTESPK